jgi:hypothetical protein
MVRTSDDPGFDQFWHAYPRHTAKAVAQKAWRKLAPDAELLAVILEALDWQRVQPQWVKDGGEFIPHASTYLNQRRFEDERPRLNMHKGVAPGRNGDWCPHTPHCAGKWACARKQEIDVLLEHGCGV